jgi:EAL and modified HD-GYP domain-containing signal transduction protein
VPTSRKIDSLKQATTLMGISRLRSMASMMLLTSIDENKPQELTNLAVIRGRMCELLATQLGLVRPDRFYTLGLLSVMDAMLDKPMEEVIPLMPLADDMNNALVHRSGELGRLLKCVLAYERGEISPPVGLTSKQVQSVYRASLRWVTQ